jgi:hypothetical protein
MYNIGEDGRGIKIKHNVSIFLSPIQDPYPGDMSTFFCDKLPDVRTELWIGTKRASPT